MSEEVAKKTPVAESETNKTESTSAPSEWVINYNIVSGSLWGYVLLNLVIALCFNSGYKLFERTSIWTTIIQCFALVEVYNSLAGITKSPLMTTVMQVASRLLLAIGIFTVLPYSPANSHWAYITLTVAWSITEIMRYYYYAINMLTDGHPPVFLKWFRYNSFLVLYPMGISSECAMIYMSLDEAEYVVGTWYKYFLLGCLVTYIPGSYTLYSYMLKQRKKVMKQLKAKKTAKKEKDQ